MSASLNENPKLIMVMGVSGSGKSTVAETIAGRFSFDFIEADDFHSDASKKKMARGEPLTDEDRDPWISELCEQTLMRLKKGVSVVLACSGLKKAHRKRLRVSGYEAHTLFLTADADVIRSRIESRDHFFPAGLLESQLSALEPFEGENNIHTIDVAGPLEGVLHHAEAVIGQAISGVT